MQAQSGVFLWSSSFATADAPKKTPNLGLQKIKSWNWLNKYIFMEFASSISVETLKFQV